MYFTKKWHLRICGEGGGGVVVLICNSYPTDDACALIQTMIRKKRQQQIQEGKLKNEKWKKKQQKTLTICLILKQSHAYL